MWDSLPWFVQLAAELGALLFLYNVAVEAVIRTLKVCMLGYAAIKGGPEGVQKATELLEKAEK